MRTGFQGLKGVVFEGRFSSEMEKLIKTYDGIAQLAPALAEVPLEQNVRAIQFGERLLKGEISVVVFMTGVGARTLMEVLETRYYWRDLLEALGKITVIARGPKPVEILRGLGVSVILSVPEPSTWREIVEVMDTSEQCPRLSGLTVAVQEYGIPNYAFVREIKKRGAQVVQVPVYRWTMPVDTSPLRLAINDLISGKCHVAFFTNSMQVSHLFQIASQHHQADALRGALSRIVTASIGPNCSQALRREFLRVDVEAQKPRMSVLVEETAQRFPELIIEKAESGLPRSTLQVQGEPRGTTPHTYGQLDSSAFMRACRCQPTEFTPIWLMRQAGRYMAEYQEIRAKTSFLELCKNSDLAAEVTITATHRLGVDAAIIFSDILLIVEPMGLGLSFEKGNGPSIKGLIRTHADIDRLTEVDPEESLSFVFEAIRKARAGLRSDIPLIGFSGAPFTLASYITEGGGSKNYSHTKGLMYRDPGAWEALMQLISRSLIKYLNGQIAAGAQAVQLFDSWVGCLSPEDYRRWVLPYTSHVIKNICSGVPVIHFSTGTNGYLELLPLAGGDVIGIDWRVDLADAWSRLGHDVAIQGNMDPVVLLSSPEIVTDQAIEILDKVAGWPGHIFNLGHGILPETSVDQVLRLVDVVHEQSQKRKSP